MITQKSRKIKDNTSSTEVSLFGSQSSSTFHRSNSNIERRGCTNKNPPNKNGLAIGIEIVEVVSDGLKVRRTD